MRVWTMNLMTVGFILGMAAQVVVSVALDRETYRRGKLRKSLRNLRQAPFMQAKVWRQLRDYNRPNFHPDDSDTDALVALWREELFGQAGSLNDKLVGAIAWDDRAPRRPRRPRPPVGHRRR